MSLSPSCTSTASTFASSWLCFSCVSAILKAISCFAKCLSIRFIQSLCKSHIFSAFILSMRALPTSAITLEMFWRTSPIIQPAPFDSKLSIALLSLPVLDPPLPQFAYTPPPSFLNSPPKTTALTDFAAASNWHVFFFPIGRFPRSSSSVLVRKDVNLFLSCRYL